MCVCVFVFVLVWGAYSFDWCVLGWARDFLVFYFSLNVYLVNSLRKPLFWRLFQIPSLWYQCKPFKFVRAPRSSLNKRFMCSNLYPFRQYSFIFYTSYSSWASLNVYFNWPRFEWTNILLSLCLSPSPFHLSCSLSISLSRSRHHLSLAIGLEFRRSISIFCLIIAKLYDSKREVNARLT